MRRTAGQRIDLFTRRAMPALFTLMLVVVNMVPLHIPGIARIMPVLPLIAVYHWAVYRPALMPPSVVFAVGLLHDVLSGTPLGVNAVVYLSVYGIVVWQQRYLSGKSFLVVWLGFAIVSLIATVEAWLLVSILSQALVEPNAAVFQFVLNFGFFPLIAWAFLRYQQTFLSTE